eukprot:CAMPEP_0116132360 /NCGR_PEP_ID=MMETSP0329-20121206/9502_1 /TAXON_ID=697910 /ORGANISM="Pseudo-nitzschia arenysensis, Strain B593" /LENGTH=437 /DNA_ID=CAMNT_0003626861 /DNA_START=130 /DNA_END=1443 /DNA_ORIENTATION=+
MSKEQDGTELALESEVATQQQPQQQPQQQQQQQPQQEQTTSNNNYEYTNTATGGTNETKWNKNGFGQDEATMTMRTGKYSAEETATIIRAVKEYCNMKQITVARLCSECDHKADLKGSWMEIAKCLPDRPVQSVYRHGLRQLHPFKRGAWSEGEVDTLIGLVAQVGKKWAHIQAKLNRSADSCRDKYREVDDTFVRGRWKENETEQLKRLIREYLRIDPTADMKEIGKMVDAEDIKIPWSVISKRMGKRSRLSCFKKWQKLTGLYSPCDMHRTGASTTTSANRLQQHSAPQQQLPTATTIPQQQEQQLSTAATSTTTTTESLPVTERAHDVPMVKSEDVPANGDTTEVAEEPDIDVYLLSELVSLDVNKASEVSWEEIRVENAQERWYELLEELDESVTALPVSEIAQLMIDRKQSAQRAAETVEAVDLPNPLWNND